LFTNILHLAQSSGMKHWIGFASSFLARTAASDLASACSDQSGQCHSDPRKKSRTLLQVQPSPSPAGHSLSLTSDVADGGDDSCACDQVAPLLREQRNNKSSAFAQVTPAECMDFCKGSGCTCLLPWQERCQVHSCMACKECYTNPPTVSECGKKDIIVAIDASNSVGNAGWAAEVAFAQAVIRAILPSNGTRISALYFNSDTVSIPGGIVNNNGAFKEVPQLLNDPMGALAYSAIKDSSTDHPQVYMTAKSTFDTNANTMIKVSEKKLLLITDGETHNGKYCKGGKASHAKYEAVLGKCDTDCNRSAGDCDADTMSAFCLKAQGKGGALYPDPKAQCHTSTCMCGLYTAKQYQQYMDIHVVGIANQFHADELAQFQIQMREMASAPSKYTFIPDFATAQAGKNVAEVVARLCA